jgi:integrase
VPSETDIESLIAALPKKLRIFTKVVKETGARPGELWQLTWKDVDFEKNVISINRPEKGSKARANRVSSQTISLISQLPRKNELVFRPNPDIKMKNFLRYFIHRRKLVALKLCNPKLAFINWKSLRHWKATMEYRKTKDILYVKELLGHKNIMNTLVYTHLVDWDVDDFMCKVANNLDEAVKLVESGFDYVTEMDGVKLFRKRK